MLAMISWRRMPIEREYNRQNLGRAMVEGVRYSMTDRVICSVLLLRPVQHQRHSRLGPDAADRQVRSRRHLLHLRAVARSARSRCRRERELRRSDTPSLWQRDIAADCDRDLHAGAGCTGAGAKPGAAAVRAAACRRCLVDGQCDLQHHCADARARTDQSKGAELLFHGDLRPG